jgi:hypothetical protein
MPAPRTMDIEIREGGRALIRISDDGAGMARDEAQLAIARHATSKIRDAEDLVGVLSFGFRGEALPAIGSVARLTIESATGDGAGVRVEVHGGTLAAVADAARRRGTTVTVESLFTTRRRGRSSCAGHALRMARDPRVAPHGRPRAPRRAPHPHARRQGAPGARPRERTLASASRAVGAGRG